jgi:hypothetical protein
MLRPTASRPVCFGIKPHLGLKTRFLLLSGSWRVCWCGAPSLTRGQVCRLQLLLVLSSALILGSESRGNHEQILLSQIRDPPLPGGPSPQEQSGPVIPPGTGLPFRFQQFFYCCVHNQFRDTCSFSRYHRKDNVIMSHYSIALVM